MSKSTYQNILVFDTETTGLIPKYSSDPSGNPYITQLSFIVFNIPTNSIKTTFNAYIRIPDEIEIPEIVTTITGITKETCQEKGISFQEAFAAFYHAAALCDCIVGHNVDFDIQMLYIELERNKQSLTHYPADLNQMFDPERLLEKNTQVKCTMRMTLKSCALLHTDKHNRTFKKFPKLSETYHYLFNKIPQNLHNSIVDVIVCLRCFLKIQFSIDIPEEQIDEWIQLHL